MRFFFINGVRRGEELPLAMPEITVGSVAGNTVVIDAPAVSARHAILRRIDDGSWTVEDRNSTNGIRINGEMMGRLAALKEGDILEFGDQQVRITGLADAAPKVVFEAEPAPAPAPESAPDAEAIRNGSFKIFDDRRPGAPEEKGRFRFSNRLFYTILACLVLCGVSAIISWQRTNARPTAPARDPEAEAKAFLLYYEKTVLRRDNAFRFELRIEDGAASFAIDDLQSHRKFRRQVEKAAASHIDQLRAVAERAEFAKLASPEPGAAPADRTEKRYLLIGDAGKIHEVTVLNNLAPKSFERMEQAIDAFAEEYGLQTIAMTPEELKEIGEANFRKAEDLFENREGNLANLRMAIRRYQMVLDHLEQFSPPPELYIRARSRMEEAENERRTKLHALRNEQHSMARMKQFDQVRYILKQIMELCDPDSPEYERARTQLFEVDRYLNRRKGR